MALLLIAMFTKCGTDKYDIIAIKDDDHVFGAGESLEPPNAPDGGANPPFLVVKVPNKTADELKHLKRQLFSGNIITPKGNAPLLKKHAYFFNYENKPLSKSIDDIKKSKDWLIPEISHSDIGVKQ